MDDEERIMKDVLTRVTTYRLTECMHRILVIKKEFPPFESYWNSLFQYYLDRTELLLNEKQFHTVRQIAENAKSVGIFCNFIDDLYLKFTSEIKKDRKEAIRYLKSTKGSFSAPLEALDVTQNIDLDPLRYDQQSELLEMMRRDCWCCNVEISLGDLSNTRRTSEVAQVEEPSQELLTTRLTMELPRTFTASPASVTRRDRIVAKIDETKAKFGQMIRSLCCCQRAIPSLVV